MTTLADLGGELSEAELFLYRMTARREAEAGRLVQSGYENLIEMFGKTSVGAPPPGVQHIFRLAFFLGANHVMSSFDLIFDTDDNPNADEENRFEKLRRELDDFLAASFKTLPDGRVYIKMAEDADAKID